MTQLAAAPWYAAMRCPKVGTDIFRVGIVGCGLIADKLDDVPRLAPGRIPLPWAHAPAYAMAPDTKIVAAADLNESVARQFAQRWGVPAVYTDYREMLQRESLDVVSVLVPNFLHCAVTLEAAAAGVKVVVCEVPMTASVEEADRMIRVCEEEGTELVVDLGSGRWWAQEYLNAREIIQTGEIGDLVTMTATVTGGLLLNGTSLIDMLRFFAGSEVTEVLGWLYDPPDADSEYVDRGASGFMRFENGVEAIFNGRDEKPFVEWDIMGSRGRIRIGNNVLELLKTSGGGRPEMASFQFPQRYVAKSPRVAVIEEVAAYLRGDRERIGNGADGRAAMEIAMAFYESHETGRWVKLPLADTSRRVEVLHGPRPWQ